MPFFESDLVDYLRNFLLTFAQTKLWSKGAVCSAIVLENFTFNSICFLNVAL